MDDLVTIPRACLEALERVAEAAKAYTDELGDGSRFLIEVPE